MKKIKFQFTVILSILILLTIFSCDNGKTGSSALLKYIDSVKIVNPVAKSIIINNDKKEIVLEFYEDQNLSNVKLHFFLHPKVKIEDSSNDMIVLDLHKKGAVNLIYQRKTIIFNIILKLIPDNTFNQESFVISTFHGVPGGPNEDYIKILENTKKANLTHIETTFTSSPGSLMALDISDRLGLQVIVQDYMKFGGFQNYEDQIAKTTYESASEAVRIYSKHKSFAGYYIWDEPFYEQFPRVKTDLELLKRLDPQKIFLIATLQSYSPDYTWENGRYEKYINDFLSSVNPPFLCTNYYVYEQDVKQGVHFHDSYLWKDWAFIRKKAIEHNIPFWFYIQLMGDILDNKVGNITVEEVAVQNYIALALGAKGISYYNTIFGIFDDKGNPNHLYDGVSILNKETLNIGNKLFNANSQKAYHTIDLLHNDYLDKLSDSDIIKSVSTDLFIGEFIKKDTKEKMLLLVNTDYKNMNSGIINLHEKQSLYKFDKLKEELVLINSETELIEYSLSPGSGELYIIRNVS